MPPTSLDGDPAVTSGAPAAEPVAPVAAPTERRAARRGEPDAVCAAAVDLARGAAEESADPGTVGDHLGVVAEGDRLVTHSFGCGARGYRGWRWAVTVARAPRARVATVCEVVLLPGADALLPPPWVPWAERLAPGDLGAGDALPYREDDPNLVPGYEATDDEDADAVGVWELGLGRERVLGPEGRTVAAERWYAGSHGPTADIAVQASAACASCGYFLPVTGGLRQLFGVCANEWSPSDGTVVSLDHGCGAHSETTATVPEPEPLPVPILDDAGVDYVVLEPKEVPPVQELTVETVSLPDAAAPEAPAHHEPDAQAPAEQPAAPTSAEEADPAT